MVFLFIFNLSYNLFRDNFDSFGQQNNDNNNKSSPTEKKYFKNIIQSFFKIMKNEILCKFKHWKKRRSTC